MATVEYFVTLEFPLSLSSQYLPPDSTNSPPLPPPSLLKSVVESPSSNSASDEMAEEYRVSCKEYHKAVATGQLTMIFDPGKPGIELPASVHDYNRFFWIAFLNLTVVTISCCFLIGWVIALFHNETWCGMAEFILLTFWIVLPTILCSYYRWCNSHHESAAVPLETLPPTTEYS